MTTAALAPRTAESKATSAAGPRRLTLLPLVGFFDDEPGSPMSAADRAWVDERQQRLPELRGPSLDVLTFETVDFMDGSRAPAELAAELRAEFHLSIDPAWVGRLIKSSPRRSWFTRPECSASCLGSAPW
jgi:hypothetical protein